MTAGMDYRRWSRPALCGGVLALVVHWWMLSEGTWSLFRADLNSGFYDAQARAWLDGRWDIDPKLLGIEAFYRGDKAYMYQGPVPALLRLPFLLFTERLDGKLAALSMLVAHGFSFLCCLRIGWKIRNRAVGIRAVSKLEQVFTALLFFATLAGSSLLFLSSKVWVYHEAIAWGVAFSLGAYSWIISYLEENKFAALFWATFHAIFCVLTRASIGLGPVAGLGLLALSLALSRKAPQKRNFRHIFVAGGGTALALLAYSAVNFAKFRTPFSVPFDQQKFSIVDPGRQTLLERYDSLFDIGFVPTNLIHYFRPDMLGISAVWPFLTFPEREVLLIGDVMYDLIDHTASIPPTMPLLTLLAIIGTVTIFRGRDDANLGAPFSAAVIGTFSVLSISYLANRYQNDFLPPLVLASFLGVQHLVAICDEFSQPRKFLVASCAAALVLFGFLANLALGYAFQRAYGPRTVSDHLAKYLRRQIEVARLIGGPLPTIRRGTTLPSDGVEGEIFVLGECEAVYWCDGSSINNVKKTNWNGVERSPHAGEFDLEVVFRRRPVRTRETFLTSGTGPDRSAIYVEHLAGERIRFSFSGEGLPTEGVPTSVTYDLPLRIRGWLDPNVQQLEVAMNGERVLSTYFFGPPDIRLGDSNGMFSGTITPRSSGMSLCPELIH